MDGFKRYVVFHQGGEGRGAIQCEVKLPVYLEAVLNMTGLARAGTTVLALVEIP